MTALTDALSAALLHFLWQGLAVALLLWITLFALRKRSANARYAASCFALAVLAILPVVTTAWVYEGRLAIGSVHSGLPALPVQSTSSVVFLNSTNAPWLAWVQSWALTVWSVGVLLFSVRIVWGCKYIYALKRQGRPADRRIEMILLRLVNRMGIARNVRLLLSSMADAPSVVGWLRPVVLLPASSVLGLTPEQLEAVIAHELAHVRRLDYLVSAFQVVIETLLFYHPAVWWTSSRIRHERELCCDDAVIHCCGDALCYAHALTALEKERVLQPSMVLGAGGSGLFYRIQRIIGVKTMEYGPSKISGLLVFSLALAGVLASMNGLRAEPQKPEPGVQSIEQAKLSADLKKMAAIAGQDSPGVAVNLGAANVVHRTGIEYPRAAITNGIQGSVSAEVTLDKAGNVVDARVLSGPTELRRAVLQSILQWHFVSDSSQTTRVVHVAFDAKAVQNERRELEQARSEEKATLELRKKELSSNAETQPSQKEIEKQLEEARIAYTDLVKWKEGNAELEKQQFRDLDDMKARKQLEAEYAAITREYKIAAATKPESAVGRVLKSVRFVGFSSGELEGSLMSRLPIREGDEVSKELIEKTGAAVRQFDEHLEFRFIPLEQNGAELQIIVPGVRRPF